ncbi:MAG: F420-dependent oxidoreductase-like protein [Glaciecola sp.]|jgi:F420-dependent oxidoreductase-like protein
MGELDLGLMLGYWTAQPRLDDADLALEAERLGFDSVWTAESWGSDAVSTAAWIGARTSRIRVGTGVMQMSARTPASSAMTALTLDHLTQGRFVCGLGLSGPQVVEGWYGQPFGKPLARTREYVSIMRDILAREDRLTNDGDHYPLPLPADRPGAVGLGKSLKSITHPSGRHVPIWLGAEGPKNVAQTHDIADGWLPIFLSPERFGATYGQAFGPDGLDGIRPGFEIASPVFVNIAPTVEEGLIPVKWMLGFYIGGMGAQKANFHKDLIGRMGFAEEAAVVQKLFLEGDQAGAIKAVPDALADEISLVGPEGRVRERLHRWVDSPVTTLLMMGRDAATMAILADELS